jgi:hypothetical protein
MLALAAQRAVRTHLTKAAEHKILPSPQPMSKMISLAVIEAKSKKAQMLSALVGRKGLSTGLSSSALSIDASKCVSSSASHLALCFLSSCSTLSFSAIMAHRSIKLMQSEKSSAGSTNELLPFTTRACGEESGPQLVSASTAVGLCCCSFRLSCLSAGRARIPSEASAILASYATSLIGQCRCVAQ